jgi:hypothetical protein
MGTVVYRGFDPVEANIVLQILRAEDILARIIGTQNGPLIEIPQTAIELRVEVDEDEAERAREILAGQLEGEAAEPADDPLAREPVDDEARRAPLPRRPRLAAGCAFLLPGGGHFYVRRPHSAVLLALGIVAAFVVAAGGKDHASTGGVLALITLVLADAIGAARAARAHNRGERASTGRQLAWGTAVVGLALLGGQLVATVLPEPRDPYNHTESELRDPRAW